MPSKDVGGSMPAKKSRQEGAGSMKVANRRGSLEESLGRLVLVNK